MDSSIINEIVSKIIELAHNAGQINTTNDLPHVEIILDDCKDEAPVTHLDDCKDETSETTALICTDERPVSPSGTCEDESSETSAGVAREIIKIIVQMAYDASTSNETVLDEASSNERSAVPIVENNEIETQSIPDSTLVQLDSDVSLIVEQIDCISYVMEEIDDETEIVVPTTEAHFEPYESNESIVVETVEVITTCNNAETSAPAEAIIQSSQIEDTKNEQSVDQSPRNDLNERNAIVENTATGSTMTVFDAFYSDELLRRRGYSTQVNGKTKRVVNSTLSADPSRETKVHCSGLPLGMKVNELIPLFEKAGQVYELHVNEHSGQANVTYVTDHSADNAIKILDGYTIKGRKIKLENLGSKHLGSKNLGSKTRTRIFVSPIPFRAQTPELFDQFSKITKNLIDAIVPSSHLHDGNRGYCYLDYKDNESAMQAMKTISNSNCFGRKVFCDWADKQSDRGVNRRFGMDESKRPVAVNESKHSVAVSESKHPVLEIDAPKRRVETENPMTTSSKVYMNYLGEGIRASDLREIFSDYGEVLDIDKSENWASVKFRHPEAADLAYLNIQAEVLGNEKVELSRKYLSNKSRCEQRDNSTVFDRQPINRHEQRDNSIAFNNQPQTMETTQRSGSRKRISAVNKNTAGAARNERNKRN